MLIAEVSDMVQIATLVTTLLGSMFAAYIGYLMAKLNKGQQEVKENQQQAKCDLDAQTVVVTKTTERKADELKQAVVLSDSVKNAKLDEIKTLVNGNLTEQKRITAKALRELANHTSKPEHVKAAEVAEADYTAHLDLEKATKKTR